MINKKTAEKILSEIQKAKNILLALHVSPDGDCLASVLAMDLVLRKMGKKVKIISYSQINDRLSYFNQFSSVNKIEIEDFSEINFSKFDLFIALDTAQERMITRSLYPKLPANIKTINIDHHVTNPKFGDINLILSSSSTSEIIYTLLEFWKIPISKNLAKILFGGIFSDTGCFQYPMTSPQTFLIASDLLNKGASLDEAVLAIFRSYNFITLKYWGKILDNLRIDESKKFIWSTISLEDKENLGIYPSDMESASSLFAPIVEGTEFGIILIEERPLQIRGSLRSRKNFDVLKIAIECGGGGHKQAAGFSLDMSLEQAEKKVLEIARRLLDK